MHVCVHVCVCMCACQVAQNTGVKNNCFQKEKKKIRIIYLPSVDGWVCSMRSHSFHWSSVVTTIQITDTHCWDSGLKYLNNYIIFHQQTMSFVFNPLIPPPPPPSPSEPKPSGEQGTNECTNHCTCLPAESTKPEMLPNQRG